MPRRPQFEAERYRSVPPKGGAEPETDTPEGEPLPTSYDPPTWMTDERSLEAWAEGLTILRAAYRRLNDADLGALARWAKFRSDWIKLSEYIDDVGLMSEDRFGASKPNPALSARDSVERSMRNLEKALGLDPDSHASLVRDLARTAQDKSGRGGGTGAHRKRVGGFLVQKKADKP